MANSKPWFDAEIISAIQKRGKLYSGYKNSGLETDKDKLKTNIFSKDAIQKKELLLREKYSSKLLKSYENF